VKPGLVLQAAANSITTRLTMTENLFILLTVNLQYQYLNLVFLTLISILNSPHAQSFLLVIKIKKLTKIFDMQIRIRFGMANSLNNAFWG
jgi:hypothetical protein